MKTSELTGAALDWAVAKAKGYADFVLDPKRFMEMHETGHYNYSTEWTQGGPIIEQEMIAIRVYTKHGSKEGGPYWVADAPGGALEGGGDTPLEAAMRAYVWMKLGDEVDIPEELL